MPSNPPGFTGVPIVIGAAVQPTGVIAFATTTTTTLTAPAGVILGRLDFDQAPFDFATPFAINFNYLLHIKDNASGDSGDVNFTGKYSGTVNSSGAGTISSFLTNLAETPPSLTLGDYLYSFSWAKSSLPTGASPEKSGTLLSKVTATQIGTSVPEPGSLALLAGLAVPLALFARRRKKSS